MKTPEPPHSYASPGDDSRGPRSAAGVEDSAAGVEDSAAGVEDSAAGVEQLEATRTTVGRLLSAAGEPGERRFDADQLMPLLYDELRRLARARLARERPGQTLQPTALVHEVWLRLVGDSDPGWNGRSHFFGAAAHAMRRILVEQARRKGRLRHGGDQRRLDLDHLERTAAGLSGGDAAEVLAVDQALGRLERRDRRKARIVELRWFGGLTTRETADVLGVSVGTVERDWRFIRAWLRSELGGGSDAEAD